MKKPTHKVKTMKGWGILLRYENNSPYLFCISRFKADVMDEYKKSNLYKPEYKVIPVEITFKI
jgi:hypothetical protein